MGLPQTCACYANERGRAVAFLKSFPHVGRKETAAGCRCGGGGGVELVGGVDPARSAGVQCHPVALGALGALVLVQTPPVPIRCLWVEEGRKLEKYPLDHRLSTSASRQTSVKKKIKFHFISLKKNNNPLWSD